MHTAFGVRRNTTPQYKRRREVTSCECYTADFMIYRREHTQTDGTEGKIVGKWRPKIPMAIIEHDDGNRRSSAHAVENTSAYIRINRREEKRRQHYYCITSQMARNNRLYMDVSNPISPDGASRDSKAIQIVCRLKAKMPTTTRMSNTSTVCPEKEDNTITVSPAKWQEAIVCTWTYQILYRLMVPPEKLQGHTNSMSPESQNADDRSHIEYQYCMSRRKNSCFHTTFSVGSTVDLQRHYF